MSNETWLFSSLLNETRAADSKEEERVGGYSQEIALNSLWKYLSCTEKLKTSSGLKGNICSLPADPFFTTGKNTLGNQNIFHYTPALN